MLDVIEKGPCRESDKAPVLFVHVAWHGAWCWDEHFLDFFAEKGYRSLVVSLRGHGKSTAPKHVRFCSIADFVDDVVSVADSLPQRPVVVGHSLGGFVVQQYLESHDAPAAVLLASAPPNGITGFFLRRFRRHPWSTARNLALGKSLRSLGGTPELARETCPNPTLSPPRCWSWGPKMTFVSRSGTSARPHVPITCRGRTNLHVARNV